MKESVVLNFEEIFLKGENRQYFVRKLKDRLRRVLRPWKGVLRFGDVRGGSLFLDMSRPLTDGEWEQLRASLRKVPGITQFYRVWSVRPDKEAIIEAALAYAKGRLEPHPDFRVTVKRLDKRKPFTSHQLAAETGAALVREFGKGVNLEHPSWNLHIKVRPEQALLYADVEKGMGGLPVGASGKAMAFLSGGIDSPVAAYKAINRGLFLTAIHFHSVPRTSPKSIAKVRQLALKLSEYQGPVPLYLIPVLEIQQAIAARTDSKLRLILLRRFFLKIAEEIGSRHGIFTVVTGDSLGQVASQTLENIRAIQEVTDLLLLRPLITEDKKRIIELARHIGTYDISVLPHDDACALFTPERPETRAKPEYVRRQWELLDVELLVQKALERAEFEWIEKGD